MTPHPFAAPSNPPPTPPSIPPGGRRRPILGTLLLLLLIGALSGSYAIGYHQGKSWRPPMIVADAIPVKQLPPTSNENPDVGRDSLVLGLLDEHGQPVFSTPQDDTAPDPETPDTARAIPTDPPNDTAQQADPPATNDSPPAAKDASPPPLANPSRSDHPAAPPPNPDERQKRYFIQLASFADREKSLDHMNKITHNNNTLLENIPLRIQEKEIPGRGIFYPIQAGPLSGAAEARRLCRELNESKQDCFVLTLP